MTSTNPIDKYIERQDPARKICGGNGQKKRSNI